MSTLPNGFLSLTVSLSDQSNSRIQCSENSELCKPSSIYQKVIIDLGVEIYEQIKKSIVLFAAQV